VDCGGVSGDGRLQSIFNREPQPFSASPRSGPEKEAHIMNITYAHRLALGVTLVATLAGSLALAGTSASGSTATPAGTSISMRTGQRTTPNGCILLNGGDYNACNVGNSGRGDLPYKPVK
jgi:hypothetical protein